LLLGAHTAIGIGFDGWRSEEVQVLAPFFQRAAEHCDTEP
jgi:hypothetical protein